MIHKITLPNGCAGWGRKLYCITKPAQVGYFKRMIKIDDWILSKENQNDNIKKVFYKKR